MAADAPREACQALTASGRPCKNSAQPGSDYCHIHLKTVAAQPTLCQATLPDGSQCRNEPAAGGAYCAVHLELAAAKQAAARPATRAATAAGTQVDALIGELEGLVTSLQSQLTAMKAPADYGPRGLLRAVRQNVDRFTPELVRDMRENLQGASREDLLDPDTWKGLLYMVGYSAQFQAEQFKQRLTGKDEEDD